MIGIINYNYHPTWIDAPTSLDGDCSFAYVSAPPSERSNVKIEFRCIFYC